MSGNLSAKYITVDDVIYRISRVFPEVEVNRQDAAEWVLDVIKDLGVFEGFVEKTVTLDVVNCTANLPCDVWRVLHVDPGSSYSGLSSAERHAWKYENHGDHLTFDNSSTYGSVEKVTVNYKAFVLDDFNYPRIIDAGRDAAMYYIVWKLKEADFIAGRITNDKFQYLQDMFYKELAYAQTKTGRWRSRDQLDRIVRTLRTVIRPAHFAR